MTMTNAEATPSHEFTLRAVRRIDAETGLPMLDLEVRTVREFASYGYRIDLRDVTRDLSTAMVIEIGGISLPSIATASSGAAVGVMSMIMPADGEYRLDVTRKQRSATFRLRIADGIPTPLGDMNGGFIIVDTAS
jgi:hypothetical protein